MSIIVLITNVKSGLIKTCLITETSKEKMVYYYMTYNLYNCTILFNPVDGRPETDLNA